MIDAGRDSTGMGCVESVLGFVCPSSWLTDPGNVVGLGGILVELEAENTHAAILVVGPGPMVGEKGGSS